MQLLSPSQPPYHVNVGKRLVKSSKTYIRDSGLAHNLLRLDDHEAVLGHPVAGMSWEGFIIESLLRAAPERTEVSFYRTATGVEIDLLLDMGSSHGLWAIEIKRSSAPKIEKGFYRAIQDIKPDKAFVVYPGAERYPKGSGIEVISLEEITGMMTEL